MTINFFRRSHGNPAGNESTEPSRTEHIESLGRQIDEQLAALYLAWYSASYSIGQKLAIAKTACLGIFQVFRSFEERQRSRQAAHGSATENAKEVATIPAWIDMHRAAVWPASRTGAVKSNLILPSGKQLCFDLYCANCHFQCWECPTCNRVRCACEACPCQLEPIDGHNSNHHPT